MTSPLRGIDDETTPLSFVIAAAKRRVISDSVS